MSDRCKLSLSLSIPHWNILWWFGKKYQYASFPFSGFQCSAIPAEPVTCQALCKAQELRAERCREHTLETLRLEGKEGDKRRWGQTRIQWGCLWPRSWREQLKSLDMVDKEGTVSGGWEGRGKIWAVNFVIQGGNWSSMSFWELSLMTEWGTEQKGDRGLKLLKWPRQRWGSLSSKAAGFQV